jgi:hypothetical protein
MYTIDVKYTDGNSFRHYEVVETLKFSWNIDVAKENLKRIKNHYESYNNRNGYVACMLGDKEVSLLEFIKTQPWYDEDSWSGSIIFLQNDGSSIDFSTPWTSYFASLIGAKIVVAINEEEDGDEMEFTV